MSQKVISLRNKQRNRPYGPASLFQDINCLFVQHGVEFNMKHQYKIRIFSCIVIMSMLLSALGMPVQNVLDAAAGDATPAATLADLNAVI